MSCLGIVEVQEDHQVEELDFAVTDIYSNINMSVCNDSITIHGGLNFGYSHSQGGTS